MLYDPIAQVRTLGRRRIIDPWAIVAAILVFAGSMCVFLREYTYEMTDLYIHASIAADFDFADLHTITSRLSYPLWHIVVSILHQLGMPLRLAAAGMCAFCKALTFLLVYVLLRAMAGEKGNRWAVLGLSLFLMIVTGVRIIAVSRWVYRGVGSPTVWHNPTQQIVIAAMMLVMPWLAHCWYDFARRRDEGQPRPMLPWWKVIVLAVLCMGSVACKPTFLQALLPAAFVMFLVELLRDRGNWRYYGQIVLAFLPAVGYFLLSYLYYTGVVVEFTSGVEIGITAETAWVAVRNALMMSLCPFVALIACWRKGILKDRMLVLALLMVAFSALEAMAFRETGQREGHGNFTWAANSSAFFLWVVMCGVFLRCFMQDVRSGALTLARKIGYALTGAAFAWHLYSSVFYVSFLMTTTMAF